MIVTYLTLLKDSVLSNPKVYQLHLRIQLPLYPSNIKSSMVYFKISFQSKFDLFGIGFGMLVEISKEQFVIMQPGAMLGSWRNLSTLDFV